MKINIVRLYVNDPMGKRWEQNVEAASLAARELGAGFAMIKKISNEFLRVSKNVNTKYLRVGIAVIIAVTGARMWYQVMMGH